jgi:hypothetical protein
VVGLELVLNRPGALSEIPRNGGKVGLGGFRMRGLEAFGVYRIFFGDIGGPAPLCLFEFEQISGLGIGYELVRKLGCFGQPFGRVLGTTPTCSVTAERRYSARGMAASFSAN